MKKLNEEMRKQESNLLNERIKLRDEIIELEKEIENGK